MKLAIFDLDNTLYKIPKEFDEAVISNIYRFYKKYFGLKDDEEVRQKIRKFRAEYGSNPRAFYCNGNSETYFAEVFSSVEPAKYLKKEMRSL
jgi:FMN phosphatase YigB (HAD superfamily)